MGPFTGMWGYLELCRKQTGYRVLVGYCLHPVTVYNRRKAVLRAIHIYNNPIIQLTECGAVSKV